MRIGSGSRYRGLQYFLSCTAKLRSFTQLFHSSLSFSADGDFSWSLYLRLPISHRSQFIHWQIFSDHSFTCKKKANQSFLFRYCEIISAALEKTGKKRTVLPILLKLFLESACLNFVHGIAFSISRSFPARQCTFSPLFFSFKPWMCETSSSLFGLLTKACFHSF